MSLHRRNGALAVLLAAASPGAREIAGPRPPAVAGEFYPGDAAGLRASIRAFLDDALPVRAPGPVAVVVPHAGYAFSGQIAADAFRQAQDSAPDVVVILGTHHTVGPFDGAALDPHASFRTPLGVVPVDTELRAALLAAAAGFSLDAGPHDREHSVEVQVPFVQVLFPAARILPAVVGSTDPATTRRLGRALADALRGRRALIVASSDLSHYPAWGDAVAADHATLAALARLDGASLQGALRAAAAHPGLQTGGCGEPPMLVAIEAARALGATHGVVLAYANSGDTALGEHDRVVGYGALAFVRGEGAPDAQALARPAPASAETALLPAERETVLRFARETLRRYLESRTTPLARPASPALARPQGLFVTLRKRGELRGCIGRVSADLPLLQAAGKLALSAAFEDPRFPALQAAELGQVTIEVSLLTPPRPVAGPAAVVLGRDGIVLRSGARSALFLPEVATEQGWNLEETLSALSRKAGLSEDAWRGASLSTFQTVAIHESAPGVAAK
jgi:AmmeMemoRadiSam system protein B/AmmeMemoRadiSam system protein A